ncbi:MAG: YbhB/YbcL family Raf kinase inhibitor-like protein, partial [Pyrinomonadaceae bacterium]|nr:YbhB/YbcL family Raf kinase inhibitor-like protein [Phycisphaerales bacterium]
MTPRFTLVCLSSLMLQSSVGYGQAVEPYLPPMPSGPGTDVQITGHIVKPKALAPAAVSSLHVPDGFQVEKFAENLGNGRMLAIAADGTVYVTRRDEADVLMLKVDPKGRASDQPMRVASRAGIHGIALHEGKVYLATVHEIFRGDVKPDGTFGPLEMIVHDLPDAGQHHTRTVQFGPDGMMYVCVGSTCNECAEPNPENAALLKFSPDGKQRTIFAHGLRDTIGWAWHPSTGELWGMDHGMDWLGDDVQPEELNLIKEGSNYGWPYFFADNLANPRLDPPAASTMPEWQKISIPMEMGYVAHSAPMQMSFYSGGQFPAEFRGDAFVSMHGSWNRKPPSGYEVVRIRFKEGKPVAFEPFVTGFLTSGGQQGRPCGNAVARDGSLLFTDDHNGVIYRVSYRSSGEPSAALPPPSTRAPLPVQTKKKLPLAIESPETQTKGTLTVQSPAYSASQGIPVKYSAYDQNASPPLSWTQGPSGTKSFAILMDDPDADVPLLPVSHWVVWNVPAQRQSLQEGLASDHRLLDPAGMCQGANYTGKVGYSGPKPPKGDAPHHYHIQIFALDVELDLPLGANRAEVLAAMKGHVLASGDLIGT